MKLIEIQQENNIKIIKKYDITQKKRIKMDCQFLKSNININIEQKFNEYPTKRNSRKT